MSNFEGRHECRRYDFEGEFFQIQSGCLFEVRQRFIHRIALSGCARFRIVCHIAALRIGSQNSRECHARKVRQTPIHRKPPCPVNQAKDFRDGPDFPPLVTSQTVDRRGDLSPLRSGSRHRAQRAPAVNPC